MEGGRADLELLGGRLAGRDEPLDLCPIAWMARPSAESGRRSANANSSTAPDVLPPRRRASDGPGRLNSRSTISWPAVERMSRGTIRFEPQRSCSLGASVGSKLPRS